jgi:serine/threonine protein kinase
MRVTQQPAAAPRAPGARERSWPTVGPCRLVRLLGEGEWCQVFQAAPLRAADHASADYAVKLVKESHGDDRRARALLQNESFVAGTVAHPHVMCLLSSHVDGPPYYVVMPFQEGVTLRDYLCRSPRPSLAQSLWVARQVAEGLCALHEQGWVHRDVKPENVQLAVSGHATLCDLGLARRMNRLIERVEMAAGSPAYMPPEAFGSSGSATAAMDCYSLGIMLYEMLLGRRPFPQQDASELIAAHRLLRPADPRHARPDIPASVAHLLRRLLAKEPLRRPTGRELIDWLVDAEIDAFDLRQAA